MAYSLDLVTRFTVKSGSVPVMYNTNDIADEAHDEAQMQYMEVANGATDLAVPLGGLTTVEALSIVSDQSVSFKINGGSVGIPCKSLTITGAAITAMTISNASGQIANLKMAMVGT